MKTISNQSLLPQKEEKKLGFIDSMDIAAKELKNFTSNVKFVTDLWKKTPRWAKWGVGAVGIAAIAVFAKKADK